MQVWRQECPTGFSQTRWDLSSKGNETPLLPCSFPISFCEPVGAKAWSTAQVTSKFRARSYSALRAGLFENPRFDCCSPGGAVGGIVRNPRRVSTDKLLLGSELALKGSNPRASIKAKRADSLSQPSLLSDRWRSIGSAGRTGTKSPQHRRSAWDPNRQCSPARSASTESPCAPPRSAADSATEPPRSSTSQAGLECRH